MEAEVPEGEGMSGLNALSAAAGAQEVHAGAEAEPHGSPPVAAGGPEPQAGGLMVELDPKQVAANSIMPGASQHVVKDWVPKKNKGMPSSYPENEPQLQNNCS